MRQALLAVDGVVLADVSYEDERAEIRYHPDVTSPNEMILAIGLAGFSASFLD